MIALEPEPYLRAKAELAAQASGVAVRVRPGVADAIELPDGSVDAAVASLVLCSVPDQARALAELRRVLRPGGGLRFLEHVRSIAPRKARMQTAADRTRIWPLLAGGCHCSRDTVEAIRAAGFDGRTRWRISTSGRVEHHESARAGERRPVTLGNK